MNRNTIALALIVCTALAIASPLSAAESAANAAGAASTAAAAAASKGEPGRASAKKICLNLSFDTGTRLQRRECKTKEEWAAEGIVFSTRR